MSVSGTQRRYPANVPAAGAAVGQTTIVLESKVAGVLSEAVIQPASAVTANAGNYRTFTLFNRKLDGSGTTSMATLDTSTTGLADNDERAMTLSGTAGNLAVANGDILEMVETVTGTGVFTGNECRVADHMLNSRSPGTGGPPISPLRWAVTRPGHGKDPGKSIFAAATLTGLPFSMIPK